MTGSKTIHRTAFEEYSSRIADLESVKRIMLFGSVARGDHGANSDVDVLVEVENLSQTEEIEEKAFKTASEKGVSITPVIVKEGKKNSFMETVEKEGVEYVRS